MATVCTLTGTIKNIDDTININAYVMFTATDKPAFAGNTGLHNYPVRKLVDPTTGVFTIDLLVGATVRIEIPCMALDRTVVVPDEESITLPELL